MKSMQLLLAGIAIVASAACNAEKGAANSDAPITAVAPPQGGDWSKMVTKTAEGGYLMGNPNADVKLVEFGSMTCPHCREFAEQGFGTLTEKYVKSGRVSYEFRNYVRDGLDLAMSVVARCGPVDRFYPMTDALFKSQSELFEKVQSASPEQQQSLGQTPQGLAQLAGLSQWAAQRGLPSARTNACLANQNEANQLVQMNTDANTQYPEFQGTPGFVINGKYLKDTATWEKLEPQLRAAIGERG